MRWYLEQFLSNPQLLQTGPAEQIRRALQDWGIDAFNALFGRGRGRGFYRDAFQDGLEKLTLKIASLLSAGWLVGHPLLMEWVLTQLGGHSAVDLTGFLRGESNVEAKLGAVLSRFRVAS